MIAKRNKELAMRAPVELGKGTSVSWDGFYLVLEAGDSRVETSISLPPDEMHNLFYYLSALLVHLRAVEQEKDHEIDPEIRKFIEENFKDFLEQVDNVLDNVDKEAP